MCEVDHGLLARLAEEPEAGQWAIYRWLVRHFRERPVGRPEQAEVCEVEDVSKTSDILDSISRHLTVPNGPRATGFPAALLPDLEEGRKRRAARQKEYQGFVNADLGAMWAYATIPQVGQHTREVEVCVHLAGMAEIRRYYVANSCGWMVGNWPFASAIWAVLPYPDAKPEFWHYAQDVPEALAIAQELGQAYHAYRPPVDRPKAATWQERLRDAMAEGVREGITGHLLLD